MSTEKNHPWPRPVERVAIIAMLRLPASRLECPLSEPSQQVCPHWILVVLHQTVREIVYMGAEVGRNTAKCLKCVESQEVEYARIDAESPMRALTATKRVLFVRHGRGAHNRTIKNWGMVDPELDEVGEGQVAELNQKLAPYLSEVQLVVTSPLTRAMQTATGGAPPWLRFKSHRSATRARV
jgi:hypothetical protein